MASQPIENKQCAYGVFAKKHYMECTTLKSVLIGYNELAETLHNLLENVRGNETIAQYFLSPLCPWSRRTASVLPLSMEFRPALPAPDK